MIKVLLAKLLLFVNAYAPILFITIGVTFLVGLILIVTKNDPRD